MIVNYLDLSIGYGKEICTYYCAWLTFDLNNVLKIVNKIHIIPQCLPEEKMSRLNQKVWLTLYCEARNSLLFLKSKIVMANIGNITC